jgi:hypothetical protein
MKLAAVERLDTGASIAEVARGFEVNDNLLHRWRCRLHSQDLGEAVIEICDPLVEAFKTFPHSFRGFPHGGSPTARLGISQSHLQAGREALL